MNRLECYQAFSAAFDTWACNGFSGRPKTDSVYLSICENRDTPPNYLYMSTCADRCHAKLWRVGCELPFVNREERSPLPNDWHRGVNISNLHDLSLGSPCLFATNARGDKFACPPSRSWVPMVGDELLTWSKDNGSDAHSLSIVSINGAEVVTANYGASGCSLRVNPGAILRRDALVLKNGAWHYGHKPVQRVLRIEDYIETLTRKAYLEGVPFDERYTGEVRDWIEKERD